MKKLTLVLIAFSLFVASPVMGSHDGKTLKRYCEMALLSLTRDISQAHSLEDFNICVSNTYAVFSAISQFGKFVKLEHPNAFSCIPGGIQLPEAIKLVHTYLEKHPDRLNADAITLIMEAIVEAFPCPETGFEK